MSTRMFIDDTVRAIQQAWEDACPELPVRQILYVGHGSDPLDPPIVIVKTAKKDYEIKYVRDSGIPWGINHIHHEFRKIANSKEYRDIVYPCEQP